MQDMYWEIPKEEVLQSFTWAVSHLGPSASAPSRSLVYTRGVIRYLTGWGRVSKICSGMYLFRLSYNR